MGWCMLVVVLAVFATSCKTVETVPVEEPLGPLAVSGDGDPWQTMIKEWEDYMALMEHDEELSIDTILRFTDGYLDAKDVLYRRQVEAYERALDLYRRGRLEREPVAPRKDYSKLIRYFSIFSKRYRDVHGADAILYALGYGLQEEGRLDDAAEVYEELVREYPRSSYFAEVNFRLGEFYFDTGRMAEALEAYSRILAHPVSEFYDKALYKLGWIYYKLDDLAKSVDSFLKVADLIDEADYDQGGLQDEALSGAVMSLSRYREVSDAVGYLEELSDRGYARLLYKRLASRLLHETRYSAAISVYSSFVELFPDDGEVPFIYGKMADLYERIGDKDASLEMKFHLARRYNRATAWYRENHPGGSERLDSLVASATLSATRAYYKRGKKSKSMKDLGMVIEGCRLFLLSFPDRTREYREVNLMLAETLFDARMYAEAVDEYVKAAALYPSGRKKADIAYSAFLTYEIMFYRSKEGHRERFIAGAESVLNAYREDLSAHGSLEKALYKLSDMYSVAGAYARAREVIEPLVEGRRPIDALKKSAELSVAGGDLPSAERFYARLVRLSGDPVYRERLARVRYRIAEGLLAEGSLKDASVKFDEAFRAAPGAGAGESALIKLARIHIQERNMDEVKRVARRLEKAYPRSNAPVSIVVEAARAMEKEDASRAADLYEYASTLARAEDDSLNLLFAAGVLYEKAGDYSRAESAFRVCAGKKGMDARMETELLFRLGRILVRTGKKKQGIRTLMRIAGRRGPEAAPFAVRAGLMVLNDRLDEYLKIRLVQPFEKTLKRKSGLLQDLLSGYSDLGQRAGSHAPELLPEIFFSMGMALEDFRDSILTSQRPAGLTRDELEEYSFQLEEMAYPYDERAVGAYEKSLKVGVAQRIYDEWFEKSLERLADLRPALYKRSFDEEMPSPVYVHEWATGAVAMGGGGE